MKKLLEKILSGNFIETKTLTEQILIEKIGRGMKLRKTKVMDKEQEAAEGSQSHTPKPYYK